MKGALGQIMRQAQQMQEKMRKAQEEVALLEVTGEAGAEEAAKTAGSGYRETEHVKTFYDTARF